MGGSVAVVGLRRFDGVGVDCSCSGVTLFMHDLSPVPHHPAAFLTCTAFEPATA